MSDQFTFLPITKIECKSFKVEVKDIESFEKLIAVFKAQLIFVEFEETDINDTENLSFSEDLLNKTKQFANSFSTELPRNKKSNFYIIEKETCYAVNAKGFQTFEEYHKAKLLGFDNADDYTASEELKFESAENFNEFRNSGFKNKETFENAKELGFLGAFEKLNKDLDTLIPEAKQSVKYFKNDADIFNLAQQKNYNNFDIYIEAVKRGFAQNDASDFKLASEKGFDTATNYYKARNKGFETAEESQKAEALKLDNKFELSIFENLNTVKENFNFSYHDQAHVYKILSELENGTTIDLKKIHDIFNSEKEKLSFKSPNNAKGAEWLSNSLNKLLKANSIPEWYKIGFKTKEELKTFIISNQQINKVGKFDIANETFTKN